MEAKQPVYSRSLIKRLKIQAPIPFEAGRKAGIREVVEFSDDICILHGDADARVRQGKVLRKGNCYECWKAQLKEWGPGTK